MTKNVIITILFVILPGCNLAEESTSLSKNFSQEKIWVFSQFNVPEEADKLESYYYYGKVSKSLYENIANNKVEKGFILLEDVRYWGSDNLIYSYRDLENQGDILFRIEDIRRLKLVHKEPIVGLGSEQFDEQEKDEVVPSNTIAPR